MRPNPKNKNNMDALLKELTLYINNSIASQIEEESFIRFVKQLKSSKKIQFIYRGESNLYEQYNSGIENISVLSQHIFILGEKGRLFVEDKLKKYDNSFDFIWEQFNQKVCKLKFKCENTIKHVGDFLENSREIKQYFLDESNKTNFINYKGLPEDKRIKVSDYYLALLHTIGKSGNSRSYFLSSSRNISIAEEFKNNGIILYGWVPKKHLKNKTIEHKDIEEHESFIKSIGLPIYNIPVYPEQKEICLKCGLLPHYILGFQHDNKFYINPSTLKPWKENIPYNGLDIDQSLFIEKFKDSNYKQSFIFCDGKYYIISNNDIFKI